MNAKTFFYDFGKAIYHVDAVYDEFAKTGKVAPAPLWILYALNDGKEHTQREICEDWELPKSTVNTVMTEFKQNGYVMLTPIKGKRREMTVELTPSGKEYADRILEEIYKKEAKAFKQLDAEDRKLVARLEKIVALLRK